MAQPNDEANSERIYEQADLIALQVDSFTPVHSAVGMAISMWHRFPRAPFSVFAAMPQAWLVSFPFRDVERVGRP